MKKLGYIVAALGALAVAAPSLASAETMVIKKHRPSAETIVIKKHHHGLYGARAEMREHRDFGWHRGWRHHTNKVVVIRHRHRY